MADDLVPLDGDERDRETPGATQGIDEPGLGGRRKRRRMKCANRFDVRRRFTPNLHYGAHVYVNIARFHCGSDHLTFWLHEATEFMAVLKKAR